MKCMPERDDYIKLGVVLVLLFASIGLIFSGFTHKSNASDNKQEIHDKKQRIADIKKHNKKVKEQSQAQQDDLDVEEVSNEAQNFNNKFFNFDSWGTFDRNRKALRKDYPQIDSGKEVNISGKDVGSGTSPVSTVEQQETLMTSEKNKIAEFILQSKDNKTSETNTYWYKTSTYKDGAYNIDYMKPYRRY